MGADQILETPHFNEKYDADRDGQVDAGNIENSYTDEDAQDAVGNNVQSPLSYDDATPEFNVDLGGGVELDASGNIRLDGDQVAEGAIAVGTNPYNLSISLGDGVELDPNGNVRVNGNVVAGTYLSEGGNAHKVAVNLGNALEGDGTNNIRVDGGAVAGSFLSEGGNPYAVDVNLGSGLTGDGSNNITLTNDTITVNGNNGIDGGSAGLGGSLTVGIDAPLQFDDTTEAKINLYEDTHGFGVSSSELTLFSGGDFTFRNGGYGDFIRAEIDGNTGDMDIEGELNEGAAL